MDPIVTQWWIRCGPAASWIRCEASSKGRTGLRYRQAEVVQSDGALNSADVSPELAVLGFTELLAEIAHKRWEGEEDTLAVLWRLLDAIGAL